jgi:Ca2+-binding RTX toxin-like protein
VNYTYVREFTLPACFRNASVRLEVMADDRVTVRLNSHDVGSATSYTAPAVFTSTALQPGLNRLTFDVADSGFVVTGLVYKATVTYDRCDPAAPAAPPAPAECDGRTATIVGTAGGDILRGTGGNDVIAGGGGGDIVYGLEGDDVICVDGGGSIVRGGPGNDRIFAGNGGHSLSGDDGNDHLQTGSGGNNLNGGPGDDTLLAGGGGNNFRGGDGSDTCTPSDDVGSTYSTCNP